MGKRGPLFCQASTSCTHRTSVCISGLSPVPTSPCVYIIVGTSTGWCAGVAHELHAYPGTPHSFFDRAYEEFANESADAWQRVLSFIEANS